MIFPYILVGALFYWMDIDNAMAAGIFAGATTNTPALASIIDIINNTVADKELASTLSNNAVIGYSISYPMSIIGMLFTLFIFQRIRAIHRTARV